MLDIDQIDFVPISTQYVWEPLDVPKWNSDQISAPTNVLIPRVLKLQRLDFLIVLPLYNVVARLTVLRDKEFTRGVLANLGDHLGFQVFLGRLPMLIASKSKAITQVGYATKD